MTKQVMKGLIPHPGVGGKGTGETAVYRLSDADGQLLYVGIARNPLGRWSSHADQHGWWPNVASFEVIWYSTRKEAADEERRALREDEPLHNLHDTPGWGEFLVKANAEAKAHGGKAFREWMAAHPDWRSPSAPQP